MLIYELRNRWIIIGKNKKVEFTENEHNFLIALSDNRTTTFKEIADKIYGYYDEAVRNNIKTIKCKLLKKVDLNIKNVCGIGYRLETKIFFK